MPVATNGFSHANPSPNVCTNTSDPGPNSSSNGRADSRADGSTNSCPDGCAYAGALLKTALQQGVMESQENPIPTIYDVRFYEVQDYLTISQHVYSPAPLMIGAQLFGSLSEADQAIMLEAAELALPVQREASLALEEKYIDELQELGMEVTRPDLAPFREAVAPVIDKWKDQVGADLVDAALNFEPASN